MLPRCAILTSRLGLLTTVSKFPANMTRDRNNYNYRRGRTQPPIEGDAEALPILQSIELYSEIDTFVGKCENVEINSGIRQVLF